MDKIKKRMIKDLLIESQIEDLHLNRIMAHIELVIDAKYLNPDELSSEFEEWVNQLDDSQLFEVVKTMNKFTAVQCAEF